MINDVKKGLKLITYASNFKSMLAMGIIFFLIGIVFVLISPTMELLGVLYMYLGPMFVIQLISTLECSGIIASSPKKRYMSTTFSDIINIIIEVVMGAIVLIYECIKYANMPENTMVYGKELLAVGILVIILFIYMNISFKYFYASVVGFIVCYIGYAVSLKFKIEEIVNINFSTGIVVFIFSNIAAFAISYALRRLLYKKPIQKIAVNRALRKYM